MIPCEKGAKYIGLRYVPILADPIEWTSNRTYEHFTIVKHKGNSYTSKVDVPAGIDINNSSYWVMTADFNAQIEQYRQELEKGLQTIKFNNSKLNYYYNLNNYGVCPDNTAAENTANFNTFIKNLTDENAEIILPQGVYQFNNIVINKKCKINFQGTIIGNSPGVTLTIGADDVIFGMEINISSIKRNIRSTTSGDDTLKLVNLNNSIINIYECYNGYTNIVCFGKGHGFAANTLNLGFISNCGNTHLLLDADSTGWCNENIFNNGTFHQESTLPDELYTCIKLNTTNNLINNNIFIKPSIEKLPSKENVVGLDITGQYNTFIQSRFEGYSTQKGTPYNIRSNALYTTIMFGYQNGFGKGIDNGSGTFIMSPNIFDFKSNNPMKLRNVGSGNYNALEISDPTGKLVTSFNGVGHINCQDITLLNNSNYPIQLIGGGASPEGRIFANAGSLFMNVSGGANSLYVKTTSVDVNTGWKAVALAS